MSGPGTSPTVACCRAGRRTQRPRRARLSELLAIWRLGLACFSDDGLPYAVLGMYFTGRDSTILTGWQRSGQAGFALLRLERDRHTGVIVSLGVGSAPRGNGIGRRLLEETHHWCRQAKAERLRLAVAPDNAPALALYHGQGFRIVGRLPH